MTEIPRNLMEEGTRANTVAYGELRVRMDTVERDVSNIEKSIAGIRDTMVTRSDMSTLINRIESLASEQSDIGKPNWQAIGAAITLVGIIGAFAYWPISTSTADLKLAVSSLYANTVSKSQYEADQNAEHNTLRDFTEEMKTKIQQQRYNVDVARSDAAIESLRESSLPRTEFEANHEAMETLIGRVHRLEDLSLKAGK